ncbi:MAG: alpha-L-fucosidase [Acidobacteria bacterium]|nr:alpha-L-fucosidase [Acidobacteriota bacterium]
MRRREFVSLAAASAAGLGAASRAESLEWMRKAKFGLFMHYGVYSLLGRGEWVMLNEAIPVAEYSKLKARFTAEKFNADAICDMAQAAGMKYVNMTARHHDSFCLFKTGQTDFSSVAAPAKRDLIGELTAAARKRGLGIFYYYSYALDWRHPYFFSRAAGMDSKNAAWDRGRPDYKVAEPSYRYQKPEDFRKYIDFVHAQLRELLTQYGPVNGIWLDPIMGYYARPDLFPIAETYSLIRGLQPGCLICFKQGANGDEDFVAPERTLAPHSRGGEIAKKVWEKNKNKLPEICDTLQERIWGYQSRDDRKHRDAEWVLKTLEYCKSINGNLLLNTGPLPDGSIHAEDAATLREVGKRRKA